MHLAHSCFGYICWLHPGCVQMDIVWLLTDWWSQPWYCLHAHLLMSCKLLCSAEYHHRAITWPCTSSHLNTVCWWIHVYMLEIRGVFTCVFMAYIQISKLYRVASNRCWFTVPQCWSPSRCFPENVPSVCLTWSLWQVWETFDCCTPWQFYALGTGACA